MSAQPTPRVRANDWSSIDAPVPGAYTPLRSVSIVIPAYRARATLPYTLAGLAAQTYPAHLLEVVVVDDDASGPPLELTGPRPEHTRVVKAPASWGRANACHAGATTAEGDIVHWLDADMLPFRDEVAHHMRWHHGLDHAVVLGHKLFVDPDRLPSVEEVHDAVVHDRLDELDAARAGDEHRWVEDIWRRSEELTKAGFRAFHVHVGATASVSRELYADAGGMDVSLKLGEDIELGYRLATKGAVFVAAREARSWHLGRSHLMRHEHQVQRYNAPYIAQRIPDFRKFRRDEGRSYRVPLLEVVVDTEGHTSEEVRFTVDGVLRARPADLRCLLVGRWSELDEGRRHPLQDALLEQRLLHEEYGSDQRVRLVEKVERTAFPTQFRMHLPAGWRPGVATLEAWTKDLQKRSLGLRSALLPDGSVVRLERTAAFERALRVRRDGEDVDDVVDELAGTWWSDGVEDRFEHHTSDPVAAQPGPGADTAEIIPAEAAVTSSPTRDGASERRRRRPGVTATVGQWLRRPRPTATPD
jgi:GT2 family glycosyltransferase